jgi:hypothetical protein
MDASAAGGLGDRAHMGHHTASTVRFSFVLRRGMTDGL